MRRDTQQYGKISAWLLLLFVLIVSGGCENRADTLLLGGGPRGGSFQGVAEELAGIINESIAGTTVSVRSSGGSEANLIKVSQGRLDLGLVYSGDAYLAEKFGLEENGQPLGNVTALARVYGGAAQLVVLNWSRIGSPYDLRGKRVAIGGSRSGTALSAKRFFSSLGIWQDIIPIHVGFAMAMEELIRGDVEAVWLLSGYPNEYLNNLSLGTALRHIELLEPARASGFFQAFPFYAEATIPAGTYNGQVLAVDTFQDAVLLVAHSRVDETFIYRALGQIFNDRSLKRMHVRRPEAGDMSLEKGLEGVRIGLHAGAERFWTESR